MSLALSSLRRVWYLGQSAAERHKYGNEMKLQYS
jgi:hypothetical protein